MDCAHDVCWFMKNHFRSKWVFNLVIDSLLIHTLVHITPSPLPEKETRLRTTANERKKIETKRNIVPFWCGLYNLYTISYVLCAIIRRCIQLKWLETTEDNYTHHTSCYCTSVHRNTHTHTHTQRRRTYVVCARDVRMYHNLFCFLCLQICVIFISRVFILSHLLSLGGGSFRLHCECVFSIQYIVSFAANLFYFTRVKQQMGNIIINGKSFWIITVETSNERSTSSSFHIFGFDAKVAKCPKLDFITLFHWVWRHRRRLLFSTRYSCHSTAILLLGHLKLWILMAI